MRLQRVALAASVAAMLTAGAIGAAVLRAASDRPETLI